MITAGIDIGSISSKAALVRDGEVIGTLVQPSGYDSAAVGKRIFEALLEEKGIEPRAVDAVISTGYGRANIEFADKAMTEIICHGAGAYFLNPGVRGIIDVGGQDSKAILLDASGKVENFAMNDKCAAGTGRFMEVMAKALEVELGRMGEVSLQSDSPVKISSICTVFAESEVISMIARREKREDIIAGIHQSAAARVAILARKIKICEPVVMTGGVARNKGMLAALERQLGFTVSPGKFPQENGAIGAAVLAAQQIG